MRVIVCQRPDSATPYDRWVTDMVPGAEVVVLTGRTTVRRGDELVPGARLVTVDDHEGEEYVEALMELARDADRIVANAEADTLRVAAVRTAHAIPGLHEDLARRFRDKVAMKELFDPLPTPPVPYVVPLDTSDVVDGVRAFGTAVLKPRGGVGSAGVHVLRSPHECRTLVDGDGALARSVAAGEMILEKFMAGDVYHVDALIDGDRVVLCSASRYLSPPHEFRTSNTRSHMLGPSPLTTRLEAAVAVLASCLPRDHGVGAVHFELLADEHGTLHAGEIAARVGGGLIKNGVLHTYGVDLSRAATTLELGRTVDVPPRRGELTGFVLRTGGPRLHVPDPVPGWLLSHDVDDREGKPPEDSCDASGKALVAGRTADAVIRHLNSLHAPDPMTTDARSTP